MLELAMGLIWYLVFVVSTTFHEAAHALVAKWGGDLTAYQGGQVSLDPRPHIRREPVGMVALPLLSLLFFGWPIGYAHVPYSVDWARRFPRRAGLMSLAGPMTNLLLVAVCGLGMRLGIWFGVLDMPASLGYTHMVQASTGPAAGAAALILSVFFSMNLLLAVFNLLPVPPLDGSGVITIFTSKRFAGRYQSFIEQPYMLFIGMMVAWQIFPKIFRVAHTATVALLYPELMN